MSQAFSVIALIAAINEEDIIEACLDRLCREGVAKLSPRRWVH